MESLLNILSIIGSLIFVFVAIGLCIFSHELGHFLAGKWRGLHIDAFSLGFKPFWRKKINGVEYRLGYLPFGGYVELPQVDATDAVPKSADGTELPRAKAIDRVITAAAGPIFNIIFGFLFGVLIYFAGMPSDTAKMREMTVNYVDEKGPEYAAGLRKGDVIVKLNGKSFHLSWAHFVKEILFTVDPVRLEVLRDGKKMEITYIPKVNPAAPGSLKAEGLAWPFFTVRIPVQVIPEKDSIATRAGIRKGDIIAAVNGIPLQSPSEFQHLLDVAGDMELDLTMVRDNKEFSVKVRSAVIPGIPEEFTRYMIGANLAQTPAGVRLESAVYSTPAYKAGLLPGDMLITAALPGVREPAPIKSSAEFVKTIRSFKDNPFVIYFERGGKKMNVTVTSMKVVPRTIGVSVAVYDHPTPWQLFVSTIDMSWKSLRGICVGIGSKLGMTERKSSLKPSHMSGPLGIGTTLFNSVYRSSLMTGIYFMVVVSFALAIFNLLPFPVLDGGHIVFGLIEIIFRRPLPTVIIKSLSIVFVTLLIGLMVFVTFADGRRLVRSFIPEKKTELKKESAPQKNEVKKDVTKKDKKS
ncbi:MAG: PDZ domain-containing protein [Lentisphaerae bacterium]|nr:PDZ domain-containing protein [Lentisphaerota bacterium]